VSTRIGNVALWVADLERAERFYVDGLGLEVTARVETDEVQEVIVGGGGGSELMLAVRRDGTQQAVPTGIWKVFLFTDDLASTHERALGAGAVPEAAPARLDEFPISIALIRDPDGHLVELGQLHTD
jgi:lactoylglutathione lyase